MAAVIILGAAGLAYCALYLAYCIGRGGFRDAAGAGALCLVALCALVLCFL